mmetsp:Transcript_21230/g.70462  ORF Transcript_21230/g.70462 Transcript_21230/m.70462 type:complete len:232 (-) Transcript_21230:63-758(-)
MGQCCTREQESKRGGLMPEKRDRQFATIQMPLSPAHPQRVLRNQQYQEHGFISEHQLANLNSKYQDFEQNELYARNNYQERGIYPAAVGEVRKPAQAPPGSKPFSPYNDGRHVLEQKMQRYAQNDIGSNGVRRPLMFGSEGANQQHHHNSPYRGTAPPGCPGQGPSVGGMQMRNEQFGVPSSSMDGDGDLDISSEDERSRLSQQAKPRPAFVPPLPLKQKGIEGQFGSGST